MSAVDHKKMCNYCTCARPQKDFGCIFESAEEESHFWVRGTSMARGILNYGFIVLWKHAMYPLFWMCSETASFSLPGTKSILKTSSLLWNLLVFLCGKLKMRGQYHVNKRQDIFYHNLQVAEKASEERSYLKPRFYLHLYVDKSQKMQAVQGKNNGQDIQLSCRSTSHSPQHHLGKVAFFLEQWQTAVAAQQLLLAELWPCPIPAQQMSLCQTPITATLCSNLSGKAD